MRVLVEIFKNKFLRCVAGGLLFLVGAGFLMPARARSFVHFFAYLAICCDGIPLPTTPVFLYMARTYPWLAVALTGAAATTIANLIDYELFTTFFKTKLLAKIRDNEHSQASIAMFRRVAFPTLLATNTIVFSWDIVRLVAIAARYPRWKYSLATFVGRSGRYAVLAYLGEVFKPPLWAIGVIAVVVALPGIISWLKMRTKKEGRKNTS